MEAELQAIRQELREIRELLEGSRRRYVSGAMAAKVAGISYSMFKRRFVDTGRIAPAKGSRYDIADVRRLA